MIEMLVATAIGMVGVTTLLSFNRFQLFALHDQTKQIDLQRTARDMVDLFAREIRRAGMDPKCAGTFSGIGVAKSTEVQVNADLNSNGIIDGENENVAYRYNYGNQRIERVTTTSVETLLSGVDFSGSTIRYFDSSGLELSGSSGLSATQRNSIRRVRIELRLTGNPADPNKTNKLGAFVSTNVDLRNRFFVAATACGAS
jgi:type II secretory pathway component PulJ